MKQKFIEWFTKGNNGCAPSINADGSFEQEKTQHMFEAYQAGMAEGEARCAALAAENAGLKAEVPMGAIVNGRAFADRLEAYPFECQGGNLNMCSDWQELIRCFEHLSEWAMRGQPETPATDAFLAEVRAQGVDVAIEHLITKFEGTGRVGVPVMALEWLAKELRKGVQS